MDLYPPPGIPPSQNSYYPPPQLLLSATAPPTSQFPGAQIPPQAPQSFHHIPFGSYIQALQHIQTSDDELRTLFLAGLPEDVKAREIYNLFREFPGYESSHLRIPAPGAQPFAFAVFVDQRSAVVAMQSVNGMVFDLERESTLYVDLAKSNSRSKRSRGYDESRSSIDKKVKGPLAILGIPPESGVGSIHMSGMVNTPYDTVAHSSAQSSGGFGVYAFAHTGAPKANGGKACPCPTLFVANLGPSCTELELNQLFSRCPGFLKLKMQSTYGAPVAFVDFQDVESSSAAISYLQGTVLHYSPEGLRLEFARSRMGMRKKEHSLPPLLE